MRTDDSEKLLGFKPQQQLEVVGGIYISCGNKEHMGRLGYDEATIQSNLDYPNPFGHGEKLENSDNVDYAQATPTNSIMHTKTYIRQIYRVFR
jgi:hypothetical protein